MLRLDVACNDPDNGIFAHRAEMLQIGDAEFACAGRSPPLFRESVPSPHNRFSALRLAGKRWTYSGSADWVGNWCWNRYTLQAPGMTINWYLTEFVIWLRARGLFSCEAGTPEFCDWFDGSMEVSKADVHRLLCGLDSTTAAKVSP